MLRFLFDQCLPKQIATGVRTWNAENPQFPIDVVCAGDPSDLPPGSKDPAILIWAEREGRIVISVDYKTMPVHLASHLAAGRHSPGVVYPRPERSIAEIVYELATIAHAGNAADFADQGRYIPI